MTTAALCIPFRDRGRDPLRQANLDAVLRWWRPSPWPTLVVDDGRTGDAQFNRSAAYNRAAMRTDAEIIVYTESDMLVPFEQIEQAIDLAAKEPGLVVGFTEYRYMTPDDSEVIRADLAPDAYTPESVMGNGRSIGAVNIVSRETLALTGGWCEKTEGAWFDDNIAQRAFDVCAGPTRWVDGPAWHLYHLPGWKGDHLTAEDRAATARNKALWRKVSGISNPDRMRKALHG